jgi:pimeloyl-ACP methyl ester carboxylesterase
VSLDAIHIQSWGHSGPRVVLVHGGAQGSGNGGERSFAAQRALAERGWQLVVPDRPGHGQSPNPGRPDDAAADGAWVAELLESGAHLVGHSFGGAVALSAAARRPGKVDSLTLIEPAMHQLAARDPRVWRFLLGMLTTRLRPSTALGRANRLMKLVGIPPEMRPDDPEVLKQFGQSARRIRIPSRATLERELASVRSARIPLLVVSGSWSPAFAATGELVAASGGGRHAVIPCPHHFPQLVSEEFNQRLDAFMRESAKLPRA